MSTPSPAHRKTILYMDDHVVTAQLCTEILEMHGYCAVPEFDATRVLDRLLENEFDLVITDQVHPGPRGTELAKLIHQLRPNLPVIIVSGFPPDKCPEDVVACIQKQQAFPRLLEVIAIIFGKGTSQNT